MSTSAASPVPAPAAPLLGPTAEQWAALLPAERERLLDDLEDAWEESAMAEAALDPLACGDPHHDAIEEIRSALRTYYGRFGRRVYVGTDVNVLYPSVPPFKPDIIVVLDAEPIQRDHWVVVQEGKGIDLAIEVNNKGDFNKDFVRNVKKYAQLDIPEYFAYAIGRARLAAHRLRGPGQGYERIMPQGGRYPSQVLGLDVALENGRVRFYAGNAQPYPDRELIGKLQSAADEAQARAEQEQARADEEQARAEQALKRLGESILIILQVRGLPVSEEARAKVLACEDAALLDRWLGRAATVQNATDLFLDG